MNRCLHINDIDFIQIYNKIKSTFGKIEKDFYKCNICKNQNESLWCLICLKIYCLNKSDFLYHYEITLHHLLYNIFTSEIICLECEITINISYKRDFEIINFKKNVNKFIKYNNKILFQSNINNLNYAKFKNENSFNFLEVIIYIFFSIKFLRNILIQIYFNQIKIINKTKVYILSEVFFNFIKLITYIKYKKNINNQEIDYFYSLLEDNFENIGKSIWIDFLNLFNYLENLINIEINQFNNLKLTSFLQEIKITSLFKCYLCNFRSTTINKIKYIELSIKINNYNIYELIKNNLNKINFKDCTNCLIKNSLKEKVLITKFPNFLFIYFKNIDLNHNLEINLTSKNFIAYGIVDKCFNPNFNLKIKFIVYLKKSFYYHYEYILILNKKNKFYEINKTNILEIKNFNISNYNRNLILVVYKSKYQKNNLKNNLKNIWKIRNSLVSSELTYPIPLILIYKLIYFTGKINIKKNNILIKDLFNQKNLKFLKIEYIEFFNNFKNSDLKNYDDFNNENYTNFNNSYWNNIDNNYTYSSLRFLLLSINLPLSFVSYIFEKYFDCNNYIEFFPLAINKDNIKNLKKYLDNLYSFSYIVNNNLLKNLTDNNIYWINKNFIAKLDKIISNIEDSNDINYEYNLNKWKNFNLENEINDIKNIDDLKNLFKNYYFINFYLFLILNYFFTLGKIITLFNKCNVKIWDNLPEFNMYIDNNYSIDTIPSLNYELKLKYLKNNKLNIKNKLNLEELNNNYQLEDFIKIIKKYKF